MAHNVKVNIQAEDFVFDQPYPEFQRVVDEEIDRAIQDIRYEFKAEYAKRRGVEE